MKLRLLSVLLLLAFTRAALADTHITMKKHVEAYYVGGIPHPEEKSVYEMWLGPGKLAYITESSSVVIDERAKTMLVINKRKRTYTQTALPMKWSSLADAQIVPFIEKYPLTGTVGKAKGRKKVGTWRCKSYAVESWIDYEGSRVNESEATMWVTTAVPFSWKKLNRLARSLRKYGNYADTLIAGYARVNGFAVRTEITHFDHGFSYAETHEAVGIDKEKPPAGVYTVPDGYEKKDRLSIQDLRDE